MSISMKHQKQVSLKVIPVFNDFSWSSLCYTGTCIFTIFAAYVLIGIRVPGDLSLVKLKCICLPLVSLNVYWLHDKWVMVLWCWMPLSTIFQLYHGGQFYCWKKLEYPKMEKTRVPEENNRPVTSHCQTLSHNVVLVTPSHEWDSLTTLVVIGSDCNMINDVIS